MAKGSHATRGGWEPRLCDGCGERVTISGRNQRGAIFRADLSTGRSPSRHADDEPALLELIEGGLVHESFVEEPRAAQLGKGRWLTQGSFGSGAAPGSRKTGVHA